MHSLHEEEEVFGWVTLADDVLVIVYDLLANAHGQLLLVLVVPRREKRVILMGRRKKNNNAKFQPMFYPKLHILNPLSMSV